jgi:hypothetical protein
MNAGKQHTKCMHKKEMVSMNEQLKELKKLVDSLPINIHLNVFIISMKKCFV